MLITVILLDMSPFSPSSVSSTSMMILTSVTYVTNRIKNDDIIKIITVICLCLFRNKYHLFTQQNCAIIFLLHSIVRDQLVFEYHLYTLLILINDKRRKKKRKS